MKATRSRQRIRRSDSTGPGGELIRAVRRGAAAAFAAAVLLAAPALAHETLHELSRSRSIALRAFESDGEPLGEVAWEVYSPASPRAPWQQGRTDRNGWLSFVPDAPGRWRVRVIEPGGHGLDLFVEAGAAAPEGAGRAPPSGVAFLLRPLGGLAAIGLVFTALYLVQRRRRPTP